MRLIEILLLVFALLLLIPSLVIFIQTIFACLPQKYIAKVVNNSCSIAVLIPAHNESSGIVNTLNSIVPQLRPQDRLIVIADNCNDNTAIIAAKNGAEVVQRFDTLNRGKGYALDFGIKHLNTNPPDVVIIIDADCIIEPNTLSHLATQVIESGRPVQALYLMYSKGIDLKSKISEFAWCVKNFVRPLGCTNLGLPCQLTGTGMAVPWKSLINVDLANGNIVEDMKLGIDMAIIGTPPLFYSHTKVISYFPLATENQSGQKVRWEHGHLSMILSEAPRLFLKGLIKRDLNLIAMALDLSVPPLALLATLILGYFSLNGIIYFMFGFGGLSLQLTIYTLLILTIAIVIAWWGWGKSIISLPSLLYVPIYIILKLPTYFKFLLNRQKTWNKTKRD
jgi:glycosyltransferase involved in cell wall biosynthesis